MYENKIIYICFLKVHDSERGSILRRDEHEWVKGKLWKLSVSFSKSQHVVYLHFQLQDTTSAFPP